MLVLQWHITYAFPSMIRALPGPRFFLFFLRSRRSWRSCLRLCFLSFFLFSFLSFFRAFLSSFLLSFLQLIVAMRDAGHRSDPLVLSSVLVAMPPSWSHAVVSQSTDLLYLHPPVTHTVVVNGSFWILVRKLRWAHFLIGVSLYFIIPKVNKKQVCLSFRNLQSRSKMCCLSEQIWWLKQTIHVCSVNIFHVQYCHPLDVVKNIPIDSMFDSVTFFERTQNYTVNSC